MQDGPLIQREDVTVSLDTELIGKMVGIAEIRNITLSALVRDVLGAFCKAYESGSDWIKTGFPASEAVVLPASTGGITAGNDHMATLLARISRHDEQISALEQRLSFLELTDGITPRPAAPHSPYPAVQTALPSVQGKIAEVIDCDTPDISGISDEALVKIRQPASPVFVSVDTNSLGRIIPDKDYSLTEAAAHLRISSSTIRKYVKDGRLGSRKIGRSTVFKGQDLLSYIAKAR